MFENIKCIIFDCDGVLVDSERIGITTLLQMALPYGFMMPIEQAMTELKGISLTAQFQLIESAIGHALPSDFESVYRTLSYDNFKTHVKPIKGSVEFVRSLAIPFCVASNGPIDKMELNLAAAGFDDLFEEQKFSAYDIGCWKPDPGIFLHAASIMGFSPTECLVIDDSPAGIEAAIAGGFPVIGFCLPIIEFQYDVIFTTDFSMLKSYLTDGVF